MDKSGQNRTEEDIYSVREVKTVNPKKEEKKTDEVAVIHAKAKIAGIDEAINKTEKLHELLKEAQSLAGEIVSAGFDFSIRIDPRDFQRATYDKPENIVGSSPPHHEE